MKALRSTRSNANTTDPIYVSTKEKKVSRLFLYKTQNSSAGKPRGNVPMIFFVIYRLKM